MRDRFGDEIEEQLPPEVDGQDEEPDSPPDEYMTAHCEFCDDAGIRLNGIGRCTHVDYGAIARRHMPAIRAALKKGTKA
jgi:hypothetical protein